MKQAPKPLIDNLIRLRRKFWDTGDSDVLHACHTTEEQLSSLLFGDNMHNSDITHAIDLCAQKRYGLIPSATNAQIYRVLEVFGIEVVGKMSGGPA